VIGTLWFALFTMASAGRITFAAPQPLPPQVILSGLTE